MSLCLDSRPLHGSRQGREIAPREVDVHIGGSLREEETKTEP